MLWTSNTRTWEEADMLILDWAHTGLSAGNFSQTSKDKFKLQIFRVHEDFRLILVAEDKDVYSRFPIPLINRLEKHYLGNDGKDHIYSF